MSNRVLAAALAAFLLAASAARADLIFFKDGLVIQGKVVREKKTIVDSATGQAVDLQEGFFLVEDGARRILFPPAHLDRAVDDKEFAPEATNVKFPVFIDYSLAKPLPPIREIVDVGDWDDRCDRLFKYNPTAASRQNSTCRC